MKIDNNIDFGKKAEQLLLRRKQTVIISMNYCDGNEVIVGDKVRLGYDEGGIVVCSIDRDEYTEEHPKLKWGYLKKGVVIEFTKYGLIHYEEPEEDLVLIKRS